MPRQGAICTYQASHRRGLPPPDLQEQQRRTVEGEEIAPGLEDRQAPVDVCGDGGPRDDGEDVEVSGRWP
jgi:hypothetical protein